MKSTLRKLAGGAVLAVMMVVMGGTVASASASGGGDWGRHCDRHRPHCNFHRKCDFRSGWNRNNCNNWDDNSWDNNW